MSNLIGNNEVRFMTVLRAEWGHLRSHRGWVFGLGIALILTVVLGLVFSGLFKFVCETPYSNECPPVIVGPDGNSVSDRFYFVHQALTGDGSITLRITSMTGLITYPPPNHDEIVPGVVPWAKAGLIMKEGIEQGSPYAAVMVTGSHGVRMQVDYVEDIAGLPDGVSPQSPRWLRLTRSGDTITGYESTDGKAWVEVSTAQLDGLPTTIEVGMFVASPCDLTVSQGACRYTEVTALFDQVSLQGELSGTWRSDDIGLVVAPDGTPHHPGSVEESGSTFTVTGTGDIAPSLMELGLPIERTLIGTFAGLIAVIIVAALFSRADYQRGRVLGAQALGTKAIVIAVVTFIIGLIAAAISVQLGKLLLIANGNFIFPAALLTELRIIVGTAAMFTLASVFVLALGALLRSSLLAIITAIGLIVVPYVLAISFMLPLEASQWLVKVTPAAAFAIQQSLTEYPQVIALYAPATGYFPLSPWAGLGVLCGYTALALSAALFLMHRRSSKAEAQIGVGSIAGSEESA